MHINQVFGKQTGCDIETLEHDVRSWYENYAVEAQNACRLMTEKLQGRIVTFSFLGRPDMRGKIEQVYDQSGSVMVTIRVLLKRTGESSGYKDVYFSDILTVEPL